MQAAGSSHRDLRRHHSNQPESLSSNSYSGRQAVGRNTMMATQRSITDSPLTSSVQRILLEAMNRKTETGKYSRQVADNLSGRQGQASRSNNDLNESSEV